MLREVNGWIKTGQMAEASDPNDSFRYRPRAVRYMAHQVSAALGSLSEESKASSPDSHLKGFNFPWKWEASGYLMLAGFLDSSEMRNFLLTPDSIYKNENMFIRRPLLRGDDSRLRNVVTGSIESAANLVEEIRSKRPNAKVVFHHGKWNGIPHSGYIIGWLDVMNMLRQRGVMERDVVWVQACDTNKGIAEAGSIPFLNTRWRKSLNSYLPFDIVCSSGDFEKKDGDDYWAEKYRTIRPDYLIGVHNDPNMRKKKERIKMMGLKTKLLLRNRIGDLSADPIEKGFPDISVSQRGILRFDYDASVGLGSRMFIAEEAAEGMFDRDANWNKFLADTKSTHKR